MQPRGELWINPSTLAGCAGTGLELVVPYTSPDETRATLRRAELLTEGLNARISLVAVHALPCDGVEGSAGKEHAVLLEHLLELSDACVLPMNTQVVLASGRDEGFEYALRPGSTVLVGTAKGPPASGEEDLALRLVAAGHRVVLIHLE